MATNKILFAFYPHTLIVRLYPFIHQCFSYEGNLFLPPEGRSYPHSAYGTKYHIIYI